MRLNLIHLLIILPFSVFGQHKAYYKQTIFACELSNNDTINKKETITFLDSLRNVITTENNINNAISGHKIQQLADKKTHSIIEVNTKRLYILTDINPQGDTIGKIIYKYDENGNRIENYQISGGDTIIGQKRVYDNSGNNTKLYNRYGHKTEYYLGTEWKYDDKANYLEEKEYNEKGKLVGLNKYENNGEIIIIKSNYLNNKGYVKEYKKIKILKQYFII